MFFLAPVFSRPKAVTAVKSGLDQPLNTEVYVGLCQTKMIELHAKIVYGLAVDYFHKKSSIIDVSQEYSMRC